MSGAAAAPPAPAVLWRGMDRAALDREYNARAAVPDFAAEMARYAEASAAARAASPGARYGLRYAEGRGATLDVFPGDPGGPVFLWFHGGYWRALSAADNGFVAAALPALCGAHVLVADYALVTEGATLDDIVAQGRAALAWAAREARGLGADPSRLFVGGSSAGGQIAAMLLADEGGGWRARLGVPPDAVRGAVLLSGLYELEPLRLCHVNDWLGLDAATAERNSPALHVPPVGAPGVARVLAAVGAREAGEFLRQTRDFAARWRAAGHAAEDVVVEGRHHFDLALALGEADHPLCRAAAALMAGGPAG